MMDAFATYMWLSAYAFQVVLIIGVILAIRAWRKPLPSYSPLFRLWDRPVSRPHRGGRNAE